MLQLTPQMIHLLRSTQEAQLARDRKERAKKAKPLRVNKDKRRFLIEKVAAILKVGQPTRFALEAACRHSLRAALCLKGLDWGQADAIAADIVAAGLRQIGACRPTWQQGQPEWTQDGHNPIQRERCRQCHGKLPDDDYSDRRVFCSSTCRTNWHMAAFRRASNSDDAAREIIIRAA